MPKTIADLSRLAPHPSWCRSAGKPLDRCADTTDGEVFGAHHASDSGPGFGNLLTELGQPVVYLSRADSPDAGAGNVLVSINDEAPRLAYEDMPTATARALALELLAAAALAEAGPGLG